MNHDDTALDPALALLRRESASLSTPLAVQEALMAACARQCKPLPWYRRWSGGQWGVAGGLGGVCAMLLAFMLTLRAGLEPVPLLHQNERGAFFALDSLERIESESAARIIETDVPASALAGLGVEVTPDNAGATVRAEMLVGADGAPLALRLSAMDPSR